ncbi:hypothetical protein BS78_09G064500 [Paspalum vaginatum]|nr:hypothetical protein BS78_09G064500 [Paspalum vaginatum]KAJ1261894.1 hypothetical protein BS78_09G064500 [Paspalum vaginatum]KAJ1261895.1 hypothetical protein BS78_09G064500 [Paspalum vaginatum]KAJ1261896.1 hypothetical protein BS78_09G064500 [Paspalum vaginatum]
MRRSNRSSGERLGRRTWLSRSGAEAARPGEGKMGSACENRMGCQDDQDRNGMSNKKRRFHVVAGEGFKRYMRVPQEFGSYLREIISDSDTIKLNAPSGCIYDNGVCREMGEIILRFGWDVFATAHSLEQNDSLVFKFCGKATFKVQIYSSCSGSQKIASYVNQNPEIHGAVPPRNEMPCPGHVQKPAGLDYFTSGGSRLTKAQDKEILEMARTIRSETPLYVAVMNKSNVDLKGCSIRLPSVLMKYVGGVFEGTVKLEAPDSNIYSVSATQQSDGEIVLQSGWDAFVVAHHVQESDIIVLRHKGNSRLEAFILDRNGCQKPPSFFGIAYTTTLQKRQLGHCAKSRTGSTSCPHIKSMKFMRIFRNLWRSGLIRALSIPQL